MDNFNINFVAAGQEFRAADLSPESLAAIRSKVTQTFTTLEVGEYNCTPEAPESTVYRSYQAKDKEGNPIRGDIRFIELHPCSVVDSKGVEFSTRVPVNDSLRAVLSSGKQGVWGLVVEPREGTDFKRLTFTAKPFYSTEKEVVKTQ